MVIFQVGKKYYQHSGKETARAIMSAAYRLSKDAIIWKSIGDETFERQDISYVESKESIPGNTYVWLRKRYRMDLAGTGSTKEIELK